MRIISWYYGFRMFAHGGVDGVLKFHVYTFEAAVREAETIDRRESLQKRE